MRRTARAPLRLPRRQPLRHPLLGRVAAGLTVPAPAAIPAAGIPCLTGAAARPHDEELIPVPTNDIPCRGAAPAAVPAPLTGLAALGWSGTLAADFAPLAAAGLAPARVVAVHRALHHLADASGEREAVLRGRLRHDAAGRDALPAVGDWVAIALPDGPPGAPGARARIDAVLPRRTAFRRKVAGAGSEAQVVAANVDVALVATALDDDLNPRRLERYVTLAWESGAVPAVLLTKADRSPDADAERRRVAALVPGVEVIALSAATGAGLEALDPILRPGTTAVILGSSGVGKSTLVNRLLGAERQRTADVRADGRGRHTTTHRELLRLPGGALLIDTPGMRELQLWGSAGGLDAAFADVEALAAACRFGDCAHAREPGCAVQDAIASGALDPARLASWRRLRRELAATERRHDARLAAAARAGTRTAMRELRKHLRRKYE